VDVLRARGENLRDQAILTAFLDLFTLLVLLPFLFYLNITLAWLVVACSSVISLIILISLSPSTAWRSAWCG
jgi:ABC-type bacteriocin/lantibiotic exporter with double-glycine peptidase domain